MILSESRFPLFGIMLLFRRPHEEAARAAHVEPEALRRAHQPDHDVIAMRATKHGAHRAAIDTRLRDIAFGVAALANDGRGGYVESEQFAQKPAHRIAVERFVVGLRLHRQPPVGPKRSVLINVRSWPRSSMICAALST